ncbi:putative geranylgeranyl pyrophosphate synthase, partial [Aspergillus bombycis]
FGTLIVEIDPVIILTPNWGSSMCQESMDKGLGFDENVASSGYLWNNQEKPEGTDPDEGQSTASSQPRTPSTTYDIFAPFQKANAEKICMEPFEYTRSLPGKNTVGKVIESLRPWLKITDHSAAVLTDVMTMLQNASLMLDDIEDGSQLRRGAPAAHVKYGLSQTINSTTYVIAKVVSDVQTHLRPECAKALSEELQTLTLGQALDLNWTFRKQCPSVQEYLVMIDHKTGGFFRLMLRIMQIEANATPNEDLHHLMTLLGRYYQIRDDYQNLASDEYTAKKGFCDDLSEGKFSFPLIHLLEHSPNASTLYKRIFDRQPEDKVEMSEETKSYIIAQMKEIGSLEYTQEVLDGLFDSIWKTAEKVEEAMGENMGLKALCERLKL